MHELRLENNFTLHNQPFFGGTVIVRLPVMAKGTIEELHKFCKRANLQLIPDNNVFGFYYRDNSNGDCYYFT